MDTKDTNPEYTNPEYTPAVTFDSKHARALTDEYIKNKLVPYDIIIGKIRSCASKGLNELAITGISNENIIRLRTKGFQVINQEEKYTGTITTTIKW